MNGRTHMAGGVALACGLNITGAFADSPVKLAALIGSSLIGAVILDIDKKNTTISNRHPVVSFFTRLFTTHRGFTHSLLSMVITGSLVYIISSAIVPNLKNPVCSGYLLGYLSHLILDMLNPKGVPLFFPCKVKISLAGIKTGGITEAVIRLALVVVIIAEGYLIYKGGLL